MSVTYINAELRRLVLARADGVCEYCLIAEDDTFYGCEVDHIISEKHGGPTEADNLGTPAFSAIRPREVTSVQSNGKAGSSSASSIRNPPLARSFHAGRQPDQAVDGQRSRHRPHPGFQHGRALERQTLQDLHRYPSPAAPAHAG